MEIENGALGLLITLSGILLVCVVVLVKNWLQLKTWKRAALSDPVTGSLTEAAFQETCRKILQENEGAYSLVSLQVEHPPLPGRVFGAEVGEDILRRVWGVLRAQLGSGEPGARTGEDTFCFLLENGKPDEVCARLDRICGHINRADWEGACQLRLTCGICFPDSMEGDIKEIQGRAVFARQNGAPGRRYHFYDRSRWEPTPWERDMAEAMDRALRKGQFAVYYQPKVRVSDQKVAGAEALVRWRHPRHGLLSPDRFLPIAERYQKIGDIDRFVLEGACQTLARWKSRGVVSCPISVNLSRADLARSNFLDECYETCCRYQVEPAQIEFEIKEPLLAEDPERARSFVERLHALGFRFAVDNFGADATSLQMLKDLDVDTVKLDHSFFSGDDASRRGRYVAEALLKLAVQLKIRTVAEGIDNPEQAKYLKQMGCDMIQGFYYFKPMPLDEFEGELWAQANRSPADGVERLAEEAGAEELGAPGTGFQFSKSIVLFSYQIREDVIEFSEAFSPALGNQTKFGNVLALFRTSEIIHENDREDFFRLLERCRRASGWVENTLRVCMADGQYTWLELRMHRSGNVVSGTMVNMAQWKEEVARWKEKAARDTLTGLYNREYFEQTVRTQLEKRAYPSGAMIFIDVDDFKRINDTLGHMFGDDVLCWVAKQILSVFRHTDVIARYGGDEFVVFASFLQGSVLEERLKRLCGAFQFPYRNNMMEYQVSGSIGAAVYPRDGADYETLLDHADCALYAAKARGKDRYMMYEPHMQGSKGAL